MARTLDAFGSSSVNSDAPNPKLAPYAATKSAIANFCASLAHLLASDEGSYISGARVAVTGGRPIL